MLIKKFLSFKKDYKGDFLKSNKFIFVLKVFLLRIEGMKLKNDFLNLNKTFFWGPLSSSLSKDQLILI